MLIWKTHRLPKNNENNRILNSHCLCPEWIINNIAYHLTAAEIHTNTNSYQAFFFSKCVILNSIVYCEFVQKYRLIWLKKKNKECWLAYRKEQSTDAQDTVRKKTSLGSISITQLCGHRANVLVIVYRVAYPNNFLFCSSVCFWWINIRYSANEFSGAKK